MPRNLVFEDDLLYEQDVEDVHFNLEDEGFDPLEPLLKEGILTEVIGEVKSGKEGTVFCCRPTPSLGIPLVAAKLFRSRSERTFRNQSVYREGFVILNKRDQRALSKKTAWGRQVEDGTWRFHEFEVLKILHRAGADVPKPVRIGDQLILMEYIGDERQAAPKLQECDLSRDEAKRLFEQVLVNVELFLSLELIHADLSAYNILYWNGQIKVIDFPQAVDPRKNRNALSLLERDVTNVCRFFRKWGIDRDPTAISRSLWRRYMHAELY